MTTTLSEPEVAEFQTAVRGTLRRIWPSPLTAGQPQAGTETLRAVWDAAAAQEWTALGPVGALDAALAALRELGRAACPLPLVDVYVATRLMAGAGDVDDAIVDGSVLRSWRSSTARRCRRSRRPARRHTCCSCRPAAARRGCARWGRRRRPPGSQSRRGQTSDLARPTRP